MKQKLALWIFAAALSSCGGSNSGESGSESVPSSTTRAVYGVWNGSLASQVNGTSRNVVLIFKNTKSFLVDFSGDSWIGDVSFDGAAATASMKRYRHYPVDVAQAVRNPALGIAATDNLTLSITLAEGSITGNYGRLNPEGQTIDIGTITLLKKTLSSDGPPTSIGSSGSGYQFTCGRDEGYALYCYSYLSGSIDTDGIINGVYEDRFFYSLRPPGIPGSIPSLFNFGGTITANVTSGGMYDLAITLPGYGRFEGVAWVDVESPRGFVAVSEHGNLVFRIK